MSFEFQKELGYWRCRGQLRPIKGVLSIALEAKRRGRQTLIVPLENAAEAAVVEGVDVYRACSLSQVVNFLRGEISLEPVRSTNDWSEAKFGDQDLDFGEVKGQQHVKRAVEVSAAGGVNILTFGPIPLNVDCKINVRFDSLATMRMKHVSKAPAAPTTFNLQGKGRAKLLTILSGFVLGCRLPGHRDETDRQNRLLVDVGPMLSQQVKLLIARSTDRDNHPAAILQLIDKRLGDMLRGTGNNDGVEWRMLRPALVTIAREHFHVKKSKPSEICLGSFGERFNDLDRIDFSHKPRKNSGLVPGSGANLEDTIGRFGVKLLGHEGHNERLGNGLTVADRQRFVPVRKFAQSFRHELVTRHCGHGVQHEAVLDIPTRSRELLLDHSLACR